MEITVEHVEDLTLDMFKQVLGTLLPEEFTEDMIMSLEIEAMRSGVYWAKHHHESRGRIRRRGLRLRHHANHDEQCLALIV